MQAYRHNLKVLQELNEANFPMKKFIVDVDRQISPASYMGSNNSHSHYDFGLNESQNEAFHAALTRQLSIIQGPPGEPVGSKQSCLELNIVSSSHRNWKIVCWIAYSGSIVTKRLSSTDIDCLLYKPCA